MPADVIALLENGSPSVNHMEQMALRMDRLFVATFPELAKRKDVRELTLGLGEPRFLDRMRAGARILHRAYGSDAPEVALRYESDTVRGWGAFAVTLSAHLDGSEVTIDRLMPFADDTHFAVREWAWLALRPTAILETQTVLNRLSKHTGESSCWIRRFTSEATRPRGVWSAHIPALKAQPWLARPLLDALAIDRETYVQDSVSNWLNDVSQDHPDWVLGTTLEWSRLHGSAVDRVCRRALRRIHVIPPRD